VYLPLSREMNALSVPPLRETSMPITTWKIMVRRVHQAGYHYVATHQRGRAPTVGEQIDLAVEGRKQLQWTVAEIFKDHSAMGGIDVFTVRVDETEGLVDGASAKPAGDSP
jgi:hypothetical protein